MEKINWVTGVTLQRSFPYEDITSANAEILGLLLANRTIRLSGHSSAETFPFYVSSHRVILDASKQLSEPVYIQALNHGVMTYEVIATMLRPSLFLDDLSASRSGLVALDRKAIGGFLGLLERAAEQFESMPNTAHVVTETAEYVYPDLGAYAVYGAALARQMELAVMS